MTGTRKKPGIRSQRTKKPLPPPPLIRFMPEWLDGRIRVDFGWHTVYLTPRSLKAFLKLVVAPIHSPSRCAKEHRSVMSRMNSEIADVLVLNAGRIQIRRGNKGEYQLILTPTDGQPTIVIDPGFIEEVARHCACEQAEHLDGIVAAWEH